MNSTSPNQPNAPHGAFSRPAALIGGAAVLVAVTAIATTLALRPSAPSAADAGNATPMAAQALSNANNGTPPTAPADIPDKAAPAATQKPVHAQRGTVQPAATPRAVSACATCGKVESVTAVQKKGEGTGLGVVGGAVVGGLVGSQIGGGSGKNVATVLGAVGGGVAGNEVEKRARATTNYQVKVRMDDGSLRTLTQATAPTVGQKVTVEGSTLRARG